MTLSIGITLPVARNADLAAARNKSRQPKMTIRGVLGGKPVTVPYAPTTGTLQGLSALYQRTPRPGRSDIIVQQYQPTPVLPLDLLFSHGDFTESVEAPLRQLRELAKGIEAVLLHNVTPLWAGPWYITDYQEEVQDLTPVHNRVSKAVAHVTFTRTAKNETLALGPVNGGVKVPRTSNHVRHYRVKRGDTLPKIAAREVGDSTMWGVIATINRLRSMKIHVGQVLKLPSRVG